MNIRGDLGFTGAYQAVRDGSGLSRMREHAGLGKPRELTHDSNVYRA
jgi:hypothetical protein